MKRVLRDCRALLSVLALCISLTSCALTPAEEAAIAGCRQVLDAQVEAWNRGDLDGFAAGYRKAPDLVFAGKDGVRLGFDAMLEGYRRNYSTRERMGTLSFDSVSFVWLSDTEMMVLGAWKLARAADTPHGRFAIVLRSFPEGWRIVLDYTSSLP